MSEKIDAVITWVDGDDPRHRAKRQQFGSQKMFAEEQVGGDTRFKSIGEIFYCVASINRFAPWINKIFIVTDEQNPNLEPLLKRHFAQGFIPMEIVDHKVIFRDYEEYLPTFNSIALESMTRRIPGLSNKFIEFNDDLILGAPVTPRDFFTESGGSVCYATKKCYFLTALTRLLKYRRDGSKAVSYKQTMLNAADILGCHKFFLKMDHTPKGLFRSFYEEFFSNHPNILKQNISHRFRHASQFNPQELQYMALYNDGLCELRPVKGNLFYLKPKNKVGYITKKLRDFSRNGNCKFGCFNSLDQASEEEQKIIISWIKHRILLED